MVSGGDFFEAFVLDGDAEGVDGVFAYGVDLARIEVSVEISACSGGGGNVDAPCFGVFKGKLAVVNRARESFVRLFFVFEELSLVFFPLFVFGNSDGVVDFVL